MTMEPSIKIHPGATKWDIRQKVWDFIEQKNLANFPRPVHNRIPNFKGAPQACDRLPVLQAFKSSQIIKINPDRPQQQARYITLDGAFSACARASELPVFTQTAEVKVDPDKPLEGARLAVLQARKTLLVPTPRLRTGLFNKITPPPGANKEQLRVCATSQGVKEFSVPIGLDAKIKVDLVVVGSVAVSEKGYRIGKGEGFADMEYGMMASMGAVNESTVVVTVVHDCQIVDIPEELVESHDLTVDYILTPTRLIKTECQHPKPQGILWAKLQMDMLERIPILKKLRALEEQAGKDVTLGTEPTSGSMKAHRKESSRQEDGEPPRQTRRRPRQKTQLGVEGESKRDVGEESRDELETQPRPRPARARKETRGDRDGDRIVEGNGDCKGGSSQMGKGTDSESRKDRKERALEEWRGEAKPQQKLPLSVSTVYLGGIPAGLRVSELKTALREKETGPLRLIWQGAQHRAFLQYSDSHAAKQALEALQGFSLNGHSLQVELAKNQRGGRKHGPPNERPQPTTAPQTKIQTMESPSDTHEEAPE